MSNEQKHQAGAPKGAEAPKAAVKEIKLTPAKDLKQTVAELKKKLPLQFAQKCTQCGEYKLPHQVCGNCGYYKGKEIIKKEA